MVEPLVGVPNRSPRNQGRMDDQTTRWNPLFPKGAETAT